MMKSWAQNPIVVAGRRITIQQMALRLGFAALVASLVAWRLPTENLAEPTAAVTRWLLVAVGIPTQQAGAVLRHPDGFFYLITEPCLALAPASFIAVLLCGLSRQRILATILASVLILGGNLARLVALFAIGSQLPQAFGLAHEAAKGLSVAWLAMILLVFWNVGECDPLTALNESR